MLLRARYDISGTEAHVTGCVVLTRRDGVCHYQAIIRTVRESKSGTTEALTRYAPTRVVHNARY